MRASLLLLLLILFPAGSALGESVGSNVVKIVSGIRGDPRPMQGSGLYFTRNVGGKLRGFVVTSDHVVFHGNPAPDGRGGYFHSIWREGPEGWREERGRYLTSEAGYGLALMEVLHDSPIKVAWPLPPPMELKEGMEVWVSGYPYSSRTLLAGFYGSRVESARSTHQFFPLDPPLVEISGARGEFGMSGCPVDNRYGEELVGILSHRVVTIDRSDRPPREWTNGQPIEIRLLAISGKVVVDWVDEYFKSPETYRPFYWTSPGNQTEGNFMRTAGMWLWSVCGYAQQGETWNKCQVNLSLSSKESDPYERMRFPVLSAIAERLRTQPGLESATVMAFRPKGRPTRRGLLRPENFLEFYKLLARVDSGELEPVGPARTKAVSEYSIREGRQPGLQAALKNLREARPARTGAIGEILEFLSLDHHYEFPDDYWVVKPSDVERAMAEAGADERLRAALLDLRDALARVAL